MLAGGVDDRDVNSLREMLPWWRRTGRWQRELDNSLLPLIFGRLQHLLLPLQTPSRCLTQLYTNQEYKPFIPQNKHKQKIHKHDQILSKCKCNLLNTREPVWIHLQAKPSQAKIKPSHYFDPVWVAVFTWVPFKRCTLLLVLESRSSVSTLTFTKAFVNTCIHIFAWVRDVSTCVPLPSSSPHSHWWSKRIYYTEKFLCNFTCVSSPNMMSITKKHTAQSCGSGIMATAWGNAMNARPGPSGETESLTGVLFSQLIFALDVFLAHMLTSNCFKRVFADKLPKEKVRRVFDKCKGNRSRTWHANQ